MSAFGRIFRRQDITPRLRVVVREVSAADVENGRGPIDRASGGDGHSRRTLSFFLFWAETASFLLPGRLPLPSSTVRAEILRISFLDILYVKKRRGENDFAPSPFPLFLRRHSGPSVNDTLPFLLPRPAERGRGKFIHTVGGSLWSIVGDSSIQRLLKREGGNWVNNPWH